MDAQSPDIAARSPDTEAQLPAAEAQPSDTAAQSVETAAQSVETAAQSVETTQFFETAADLRAWFERHHQTAPELFVGYWKKGSGGSGVSHSEAIEQALCFGWIDSIARRIDERRFRVRFTPRRRGSVWSAVNIAKIAELTGRGLMYPAGIRAFELRKPDQAGVYSYEQPEAPQFATEQAGRFQAEPAAWEWFSRQPPGYRRSATHWVVTAKRAETRERRLAQLIADSAAGRKVPPLIPR